MVSVWNDRNQKNFDDFMDFWFYRGPASDFGLEPTRLDMATSNRIKYHAYNLPFVGDIFKGAARWNDLQDYMDAYGYGWADIDPLRASDKFGAANTKAVSSAVKLSKNVLKLYR